MTKRIDSTFYFLQFLTSRILFIQGLGVLVYGVIVQHRELMVFSLIFVLLCYRLIKKQFSKPSELLFDEYVLYLDNRLAPIEMETIVALENGVIIYRLDGNVSKISLPRYYFIDRNYKKLKAAIENRNFKN